jgi:predicted nucleic acid-binding protein
MTRVISALIDVHVLDYLDEHPAARADILTALNAGTLGLVGTHILRDEANAMKSKQPEKWRRLSAIIDALDFDEVTTAGFVLDDVSRFDQADLISDDDADLYRTVTVGNPKHAKDALLALTARRDNALLVTTDKGLIGRATRQDLPVANPPALAWLARQ